MAITLLITGWGIRTAARNLKTHPAPVKPELDVTQNGDVVTMTIDDFPGLTNYVSERSEFEESAASLFDAIKFGKVKIKIFKEYALSDVRKAHEDLEARKIIGPALLIPNE